MHATIVYEGQLMIELSSPRSLREHLFHTIHVSPDGQDTDCETEYQAVGCRACASHVQARLQIGAYPASSGGMQAMSRDRHSCNGQ
jgi:hypothetical protein